MVWSGDLEAELARRRSLGAVLVDARTRWRGESLDHARRSIGPLQCAAFQLSKMRHETLLAVPAAARRRKWCRGRRNAARAAFFTAARATACDDSQVSLNPPRSKTSVGGIREQQAACGPMRTRRGEVLCVGLSEKKNARPPGRRAQESGNGEIAASCASGRCLGARLFRVAGVDRVPARIPLVKVSSWSSSPARTSAEKNNFFRAPTPSYIGHRRSRVPIRYRPSGRLPLIHQESVCFLSAGRCLTAAGRDRLCAGGSKWHEVECRAAQVIAADVLLILQHATTPRVAPAPAPFASCSPKHGADKLFMHSPDLTSIPAWSRSASRRLAAAGGEGRGPLDLRSVRTSALLSRALHRSRAGKCPVDTLGRSSSPIVSASTSGWSRKSPGRGGGAIEIWTAAVSGRRCQKAARAQRLPQEICAPV